VIDADIRFIIPRGEMLPGLESDQAGLITAFQETPAPRESRPAVAVVRKSHTMRCGGEDMADRAEDTLAPVLFVERRNTCGGMADSVDKQLADQAGR
jgi:hypothetical protein